MPTENKKSWYKDPKILIASIVALLAAIMGATWAFLLRPRLSDFSIVVNPMQGSVHQGGLIQTTFTGRGSYGYDHSVSPSTSRHPSDGVVAFIPPIGGSTPADTSTVTMNVAANVLPDDYPIVIKGTGADGKERTCVHNLTVKPISPTEPAIDYPDEKPAPTPDIKMMSPCTLSIFPVS